MSLCSTFFVPSSGGPLASPDANVNLNPLFRILSRSPVKVYSGRTI